MNYSKVVVNNETIVDLTQDTVASGSVLSGVTFHKSDGSGGVGTIATYNGATTITDNGTVATSGKYMSGNLTISVPQLDVSDTTAIASDVLSGKNFYLANGTKTSGSIATYSGSTTVTENGTLATSGMYMSSDITVSVGGVATVQLHAPTISLSGLTLTITNPATNGDFVGSYDIYSGNTVVANTTSTTYDMGNAVGLTSGSNTITVKAKGNGFLDSSASNSATLVVYLVTNTLSNISTSNSANAVLSNSSYSATLTPATNWTYGTTSVVMGNTDITSTAYSNGVISIQSVTGDITITSTAYVPITNTLTGATNSNSATGVAYGSSYAGTITASSGYTLEGATISITMGGNDITATAYSNGTISIASVTGAVVIEIEAVATIVFSRTFGDNSPSTISTISNIISSQNMSASDVATTYGWNLGDTIDITLTTNEVIQMQIIGINHDTISSDHITKAGLTLQMVGLFAQTYQMNGQNATNAGGWQNAPLRNSWFPTLFAKIPNEWQSVIKTVDKLSANGGGSNYSAIVTTSDNIFLLSEIEVFGVVTKAQNGADEGTQYAYWSSHNTNNDRTKYYDNSGTPTQGSWWLRSSANNDTLRYCIVTSSGENTTFSTNSSRVSFAFCV